MTVDETLGVPAHRGGLIAERPELTVGVLRAVSRPTGLELELVARRPLDRRGAAQRQADIRAGRPGPVPAARRLLPPYDEGLELRLGWLDADGRARWLFPVSSSSFSGDHVGGGDGATLQAVFRLPPMLDRVRVVLAWPEIGFPETVVDLPLPDRATVERGTVSIWTAPVHAGPPPPGLRHRAGDHPPRTPAMESGRIVAAPRVLARTGGAVVVLTRLTAAADTLSLEVLSVARGRYDEDAFYDPRREDSHPGAFVAVVDGSDAVRMPLSSAGFGGGGEIFVCTAEFLAPRPPGDVLRLLITWPAAALPDAYVEVRLDGSSG
jgi:hypothetical protein